MDFLQYSSLLAAIPSFFKVTLRSEQLSQELDIEHKPCGWSVRAAKLKHSISKTLYWELLSQQIPHKSPSVIIRNFELNTQVSVEEFLELYSNFRHLIN